MPSEQRLHPTVLLFDLGRQLKTFALPGLLLLFTSTRGSMSPLPGVPGVPDWSAWMLLLMLPGLILSVVRYASFRLRYDAHELVVAQGLWFRSERHVPYARIQNLDAVQSIVHRALGVAEVRIETGGGADAEASIRVLPLAAVDEMRRRVFEGRRLASTAAAGVAATDTTETADRDTGAALTAAPGVVLLRLALRDVLLYGLIESRGIVLIGAVYGALWEFGLVERAWNHVPGVGAFGRSAFLRLLDGAVGRAPFPLQLLWYGAVGLFAVVALVKLASMLWSAIRLYDFTVTRVGHDVRTQFGLFTRVTTTIPLHHVQTVTVSQGPLHRLLGRVSLRVETAGSELEGAEVSDRQWLAPLVERGRVAEFLGLVVPFGDPEQVAWQRVPARAFGRAVKPAMAAALAFSALFVPMLGWWAALTVPVASAVAVVATRRRIARLGWMADDVLVALTRGWLWRRLTVARVAKVQVVALHESPFDRRWSMARVLVDTAGAPLSSGITIPYLDVGIARALHARLSAQANETQFRW